MEIDTASLPPVEKREMTELEEKLLKAYQEKHPEVRDRESLVKVVHDTRYASQNRVAAQPIRKKS